MKAELQLRKVKLAFKALHNDNRSRILHDVLRVAMNTGTQWTDEVNEHISDTCGNGKWLGKGPGRLVGKNLGQKNPGSSSSSSATSLGNGSHPTNPDENLKKIRASDPNSRISKYPND